LPRSRYRASLNDPPRQLGADDFQIHHHRVERQPFSESASVADDDQKQRSAQQSDPAQVACDEPADALHPLAIEPAGDVASLSV
jgi:hypothetical protein